MSGVSEEQQEDSVTEQKSVGVENGEVLRSWKTWGPMYHGRIFGCDADKSRRHWRRGRFGQTNQVI